MNGIEVLGFTEVTKRSFGFSSTGMVFAILALITFICIFVVDEESCVESLTIITTLLAAISIIAFYNGKETPYTDYLIHMSDDASYKEFNSTYKIVKEICDGYYMVELAEENDLSND